MDGNETMLASFSCTRTVKRLAVITAFLTICMLALYPNGGGSIIASDEQVYGRNLDLEQKKNENFNATNQNDLAKAKKSERSRRKVIGKLKDYDFFSSKYPPPRGGNYTCRDSMCSEYLVESDLSDFKSCAAKTILKSNLSTQDNNGGGSRESLLNGECRFMEGKNRAPVALVSFPGSGNTWVRGLLQQVTGICTGSVYCDKSIRMTGFNGEYIKSGSVLVVKTHYHRELFWTDYDKPIVNAKMTESRKVYFGSAIFVVRNPFHALVSDWHRHSGRTHTSVMGLEYFGNSSSWNSFVKLKLPIWKKDIKLWVIQARQNKRHVHVVSYEDIRSDVFSEMKRILEFLQFPSLEDDVLKARLLDDFSTFKRNHKKNGDYFTESQRKEVNDAIKEIVSLLKSENDGETYRIEHYLL